MSNEFLNAAEVVDVLMATHGLPDSRFPYRTIYEAATTSGGKSGHFFIDYATYPGGSKAEVPRHVIDELVEAGKLTKAFPQAINVEAWRLEANCE